MAVSRVFGIEVKILEICKYEKLKFSFELLDFYKIIHWFHFPGQNDHISRIWRENKILIFFLKNWVIEKFFDSFFQ